VSPTPLAGSSAERHGSRPALLALLAAMTLLLAACGGGGGPSSASSGSGGGGTVTACGGTSSGSSANNIVPLVVDGACGGVNQAYVTIKLCVPGSTTACQTIDHVWVDTGSTGLRIVASALTVSLPASNPQNGNLVANCAQFVTGYTWGAMRAADVYIGGESARSVPIQVMADPALPAAPGSCASGTLQSKVSDIHANGLLGIGLTRQDCGAGCAVSNINAPAGWYYTCPNINCSAVGVPLNQQLQNVVGLFVNDNNGVQLQLPAVSTSGQATATGSLVFGIGTQANNGLGSATIFAVDANPADAVNPPGTYLNLSTTYNGTSFPQSYIDSGSNGWYFDDLGIKLCTSNTLKGFYCQNAGPLTATMQGFGGGNSYAYRFNVADASTLSGGNAAFNDLAGSATSTTPPSLGPTFDWGLPFFYGRSVFVAFEGSAVGATAGPFFAATTP
jgi:hypothetical protein